MSRAASLTHAHKASPSIRHSQSLKNSSQPLPIRRPTPSPLHPRCHSRAPRPAGAPPISPRIAAAALPLLRRMEHVPACSTFRRTGNEEPYVSRWEQARGAGYGGCVSRINGWVDERGLKEWHVDVARGARSADELAPFYKRVAVEISR
jgi:hypothetical protein